MYTYYNKLFAVFYATFLNSILAVYLCGVFAMCYVRYIYVFLHFVSLNYVVITVIILFRLFM